jgi:hypothetical protein
MMGLGRRLRALFSSSSLDDEAAAREEYGLVDRGEAALKPGRFGTFASSEAADAAEDRLEELDPPRDPYP